MSSGEPTFEDDADVTLQKCHFIPQHLEHNQVPFVCNASFPRGATPRLFRSVTFPPRDARENRINRCSLSFFPPFFPASNPFYSQTETCMTPRASNSKSSCRPCKRFPTSEVLSSRILLLNDGLSIRSYVFSIWSTSRVLWRFLLYLHFSRFNFPKLFKRFFFVGRFRIRV